MEMNKPRGLVEGNKRAGWMETAKDSIYKGTFKASVDLLNVLDAETPSVSLQYLVGGKLRIVPTFTALCQSRCDKPSS